MAGKPARADTTIIKFSRSKWDALTVSTGAAVAITISTNIFNSVSIADTEAIDYV